MKRAIAIVLLAGAGLIPASLLAVAQNATPAYKPGLADLMTMTVQPRHIKLALAGHAKNWVYAKYELAELGDALARAATVWPKYKGLPIGGMVDAIAKGPMAQVSAAIDGKDANGFAAAYGQLTEGCNACHQAANVGHVVIKVPARPGVSSFPDQDFNPNLKP
jgi:hypothetical protein